MSALLLMSQVDVAKDPDRWLRARRGGVTASEIAAVLGIAPNSHNCASPFALYVAKTTGKEPHFETDETKRGKHLEPYVADVFAGLRPELDVCDGGLYCREERPWQMATFDRIAVDRSGPGWLAIGNMMDARRLPDQAVMPVQIKTSATTRNHPDPELHWGEPGTSDIPAHYRAQALYEMDILGAEAVLVPCLFVAEWQVHTYVIDRDADSEADMTLMRAEAESFMTRIAEDDPPPIDWTPSTTKALRTIHPMQPGVEGFITRRLADRYAAAQRLNRKAEKTMGQVTNDILAATSGARFIMTRVGGVPVKVASRAVYEQESTDVDKLRTRHKRAFKASRRKTPVDKLIPGTWARAPK